MPLYTCSWTVIKCLKKDTQSHNTLDRETSNTWLVNVRHHYYYVLLTISSLTLEDLIIQFEKVTIHIFMHFHIEPAHLHMALTIHESAVKVTCPGNLAFLMGDIWAMYLCVAVTLIDRRYIFVLIKLPFTEQ